MSKLDRPVKLGPWNAFLEVLFICPMEPSSWPVFYAKNLEKSRPLGSWKRQLNDVVAMATVPIRGKLVKPYWVAPWWKAYRTPS